MSAMNFCPPKPGSTVITSTMSHSLEVRQRRFGTGVGLEHNARALALRVDLLQRGVDVLRESRTRRGRSQVRARVAELLNVAHGLGDHQMRPAAARSQAG